MDKLTAVDKLDEVLKFLAESPFANGNVSDGDIWKKVEEKGITASELVLILNKLVDDKMATVEVKKESNENWTTLKEVSRYKITFEGNILNAQKGYRQRIINNTSENTRLVNLEESQKFHRIALTWLTAFLCVASLIAAWYYGIEIWKYYHCGH